METSIILISTVVLLVLLFLKVPVFISILSGSMAYFYLTGGPFTKILGQRVLAGVESRTSSPLRIGRGETLEGSIGGLYPCGEGAGYAGGITSAAMDGIKVAEAIVRRFQRPEN